MPKLLIAIATILLPTFALAHSGHGHIETTSIWHWLLEFDHIGWVVPVIVVLLMFVGNRLLRRNR
ncbi:MAG: hypothetical protein COW58_05225 [Thalassolituus sp. CG17_big_fil_post_rev_8_21_14_2_50_53_8]|nr:MAG: hypothetical protein COW58_05225 [Thalassolituus sp. CG17_big_fil_post_rev_8_21_14_2_50_53_8]